MGLRVWRYAAILVVVLGLGLPGGVACRAEPPLVQVQSVDSMKNRDHVRVQGVVSRYPDYDPITERLTFWLDDGTGSVLVILNSGESQELLDRGGVPTIGDRVSVVGTIDARRTRALGDFVSLTVRELGYLEVDVPAPVESSIAMVLLADAESGAPYSKVLLRGQVSEVWQSHEGLTILSIQDGTGEIDVVYDQDLVWISGAPTTVLPGDTISVRGAVTTHQGQAQLVLDAASGLRRLPAPAAQGAVAPRDPTVTAAARQGSATPTAVTVLRPQARVVMSPTVTATPLPVVRDDSVGPGTDGPPIAAGEVPMQTGLLSNVPLGSSVTVEARIERATLLSAGCRSSVDDGSGPAVVWMPNALYEQLVDPAGWNVGAVIRVTGRVSEYEGELEVVPQTPDAIVIIQRALPVSVLDVEIGDLSIADLDKRVTVEGEIVAADPFSAGVNCVLDDGSGRIVLLLWQNVFEALPDRNGVVVGGRVRASGWVQEYRGELEIVPGLAHDVAILRTP